jgi:FKBP-type peptidyl-prolyl cis-trans isomerase 2
MRKVQQGDQVVIEYEGKLQDGEIVESSADTGPAEFTVGTGAMHPGFEKALIGMSEGEEKSIVLAPEEAFGPKDETLLHTVSRSVFGEKIQPKPGMVLGMTVEKNGQPQKIPALVTAVAGEDIILDFNHPLAGKTIYYTLTLKTIKNQPA